MGTKKATLTPDEELALHEYHQRYLAYGLSTAPADRARAEEAFARAYRRIGREPVPVIWVASPLMASMLYHDMTARANRLAGSGLTTNRWHSMEITLSGCLKADLIDSLENSLLRSLRARLVECLVNDFEISLWYSLVSGFQDILLSSLRVSHVNGPGDSLADGPGTRRVQPIPTRFWGQMDGYWIAFYRYCQAVLGVPYSPDDADRLNILDDIGQSCGLWYPFEGAVIACDRPNIIQMAENPRRLGTYRLHATDGPALQFRDGWTIYAWHGVRVPKKLIMWPQRMTRDDILAETNVETRRAIIELLGYDQFAGLLDLVPVQDDTWNGQTYTLLRTREKDDIAGEYLQFVRVTCPSTDRVYHLSVPPTVSTAKEAIAWTFGVTAEEYHPTMER
jgi:hypothetical protein